MSNFDVSLLPVLPDGGAGTVSSGAFGGSPGEAPPDAFAQLLEELAGEAPHEFMGLPKSALSGVPVGEAELDTVALSTSADGWEPGESNTVPDSASADQNQDALAPVALTAMIAPIVLPEATDGSREAGAAISHAKGDTEQVPVVAGESPETSELARATLGPGVEGEIPFEVPAGREDRELLGKLEGRAGEQLPGRDASAVSDARDIHIERASFVESRTAPAAAAVATAEASADSGRRQDSRGEQQSSMASRTYEGIRAEPGAHPLSVEHSFSQAVAAAAQPQSAANVAGVEVPGEGNALESQIVQGMQRLRKDGAEEIRVTLRPEYLGALTITLRVEHDSVTAVMHVEEP